MSKVIVLGVENRSYVNRAGQEVNLCTMFYCDSTKSDSKLDKGYTVLTKNVFPDFTVSDFSQLPGYYELGFTAIRGRNGKPEPKICSIEFKDVCKFPESKGNVLVLAAKRYDWSPEKNVNRKGVKFFYVDLASYQDSSDFVGVPLLEISIDKADFNMFPTVPGFYNLQYQQIRGSRGDSVLDVTAVKFVSSVSTPQPVATS